MPGLNSHLYFDYGADTYQMLSKSNWLVSATLRWLAYFNLGMLVFNLVPAFPLDGGRIRRIAFSNRQPDARLVKLIAYTGVFIGIWSFFSVRSLISPCLVPAFC